MKGDFSRIRFTPQKNYTAVLQQQGRVALDADANEQTAIDAYLRDTTNVDVIGRIGGPADDLGFEIKIDIANKKIRIGRGRYYVDGILVQNDWDRDYSDQPYLIPTPSSMPSSGGTTSPPPSSEGALIKTLQDGTNVQFVLQVWRRLVTELDDTCLVEPAIGQADTTARLQTVWRVLGTAAHPTIAPGGTDNAASQCSCCCDGLELDPLPPHTGKMTATTPTAGDDCGCQPIPAAGYQGLENQLYRVEIHTGGAPSAATFKWSRENASVVVKVTQVSGMTITVNSLGPDANLGFQVGQWVELSDDQCLFGDTPNQPGVLYQISALGPGPLQVTLSGTPNVDTSLNARMRRWDQPSTSPAGGIPVSPGPVTLEYGIQVTFSQHGNFVSGDYWTIPARTANGQIDWACGSADDPYLPSSYFTIYQAPLAVARWDCNAKKAAVSDCRVSFNPLAEVDLAFHNKHLHGWGIVCGLQVNCASDRTQVTVKKGYAIDCEGHDVRLCCNVPVDVVSIANRKKLLNSDGVGAVSLVLNSDGTFDVEKQDKSQETLGSFFKDTFWWDFWTKCVQPLLTFLKSNFSSGSGTASKPVTDGQARLDTFYNLLYQLMHPVTGQHLFLSSEEDKILRDFYAGFRQVLASRTFCGLFDKARPYPDPYPFSSLGVHGIFGLGLHTRIRVNPSGGYAYTVGGDNYVHVYDLTNMVMAAKVAFPTQSAVVQDVAVSSDGNQMVAIAQLGTTSYYATATVAGSTLTWDTPPVSAPQGVQFKTLAVSQDMVYAVASGPAAQGGGLYAAKVGDALTGNNNPKYTYLDSSLFGHLVVDPGGSFAYMTGNDPTLPSTGESFNCVLAQSLQDERHLEYQLQYINSQTSTRTQFTGTAKDDIAIAVDQAGAFNKLYVAVDPTEPYSANKQLLVFNARSEDEQRVQGTGTIVDLTESDTAISLAFNPATTSLMVGYASYNWVYVLDPTKDELYSQNSQILQFPTEWFPSSIAVGPSSNDGAQAVYILNTLNRTVTAAPANMLMTTPAATVSLAKLATFRDEVLEAFADLIGLILEDLKDCFCDRFLVDCPSCDRDDKLYLGDIQISDSKVYRICNLDRRRYVKSFPTYGYWLSIIPILPVMKWLVAELCCYVLPDFFNRYEAAPTLKSRELVTDDQTFSAMSFLKSIDLSSIKDTNLTKFATAGKLVTDSMKAKVFNFTPRPAVQITQDDVLNQPTDVVTQRLGTFNISVAGVQPYDPAAAGANLKAFLSAPTTLPSGSNVVLYEQNGVVRYYALAPTPNPVVQSLTTQMQTQQAALASLQQSQQVVADQLKTINNYEQEIAALQTSLSAMQQAQTARDQDLADLKTQVQGLVKKTPKAQKRPEA